MCPVGGGLPPLPSLLARGVGSASPAQPGPGLLLQTAPRDDFLASRPPSEGGGQVGSQGCPQAFLIPCVDGAGTSRPGWLYARRGRTAELCAEQRPIACSLLNASIVCGITSAPGFPLSTQCFLSDTSEQRLVAPKKESEIGRPPGDSHFPGKFRNSGGDEWQEGKLTLRKKCQHLFS